MQSELNNLSIMPETENSFQFKSICNLCSVGCTLKIISDSDAISEIKGEEGLINSNAEYCQYPVKGYAAINEMPRITEPMLRKEGKLEVISWDDAFSILHDKITSGGPHDKAFFAGARLTNEEQYLIMKLCRAGAYSNNIGSFHYFGRGTSYTKLSRANIPFAELIESKKIFIIGAELKTDNPVAAQFVINDHKENNIPLILVTDDENSDFSNEVNQRVIVKSYFHFLQAVNYTIISEELHDQQYISNLVDNFEEYKKTLLSSDFNLLVEKSGVDKSVIEDFARQYHDEPHAVTIFSENKLSGHACSEIFNMALLTGKHGRTGAGLLLLKENNNSHGLHDMGVMWNLGPGAIPWDDPFQRSTVQFVWGSMELPVDQFNALQQMNATGIKNLFIFGEDPVGCAINDVEIKTMLSKSDFIMVQDYFMTPTAELADLVIPASMPYETAGTFTNSQRVIQKVDKRLTSPLKYDSWRQLDELLALSGYNRFETIDDVTFEIASLLPKFCTSSKLMFRINNTDNFNPMFNFGCDANYKFAKSLSK